MHIVFVTNELATKDFPSGGLGTFVSNMSRIIKRHGHQVSIILVTTQERLIQIDSSINCYNVFVEKEDWSKLEEISFLFSNQDKENIDSIRKIFVSVEKCRLVREKIKEINSSSKVDIVQYCNHGGFSLFAERNIPYVVRISGFLNIIFGNGDKPMGSIAFRDNPETVTQKFENDILRKSKYVIAPSQLLCDICSNELGLSCELLESPFELCEDDWDYSIVNSLEKKYVLYFGTMRYGKGIHVIAGLLREFLSKYPEYTFVLVGMRTELVYDGKRVDSVSYVMNSAGEFADRIRIFNSLNRQSLYPIIKRAELCVLPSRIENFSNACVEAMAMGKIVIATDGASYEQLIENGKNGFLCERDNEIDFLYTICKVIALNQGEKKQIERRAQESVKKLKPDIILGRYIDYYKKVIRDWHAS